MTNLEINTVQKATVIDLYMIFSEDPAKSYNADEIRKIMIDYVGEQETILCPKK